MLGPDELFREARWFAVLLGQGHAARDYNPLIDTVGRDENVAYLKTVRDAIGASARRMARHADCLL